VLPFESFTATIVAEGGKNMLSGPTATATLQPLKLRMRHSGKSPVTKEIRTPTRPMIS
jgi:hypothetical protein